MKPDETDIFAPKQIVTSPQIINLRCLLSAFKFFFFQQIIETDAFLKIFGHNFERTPVFTGFLIMQTFVKIPLATVLCVLLLLLITLCSANDNNSSKPRDKVSLFNQTL